MTKRALRLLHLLLPATLIFAACTQFPSPSSPTAALVTPTSTRAVPSPTPHPAENIPIDPGSLTGVGVQVWHAFTGPAADLFFTQIGQFNANNEWGITVYSTYQGDYSDLFAAMNTGLESDQTPDLVVALPEQTLAWEAAEAVVDLEPYIYDVRYGLTGIEISDIPSTFWAQDEAGGRQLGIPAQRTARFLFYNQTWGQELGFADPPYTADEFRAQACAGNQSFRSDEIEQNDGYGGWVVDTDWQTIYPWLLAFDGGVLADGEYLFANQGNQAALTFLKGLYDENCAWLSTEPTPYESFARRSALFISGDLAEVPLVAQAMTRLGNSDEWTVIPFPGPETSALVAYGPSYTLLASTAEEQLAAWLFARWLLAPENQASWVEATGLLPLRLSALDSLGSYRAGHPQWEAAAGYIAEAQVVPHLASWRTVRYVLEDGTNFIFRMNLSVEEIPSLLAEMDATAEEIK